MKRPFFIGLFVGCLMVTGFVGGYVVDLQTQAPPPAPVPPEAYPGQSSHAEPPKGFYCSHTAKDAAHKCTCKRIAIKTKEDPDCCDAVPMEDKGCTVWCWPGHCTCPVECKVGEHDMAGMEHKHDEK